MRHAEEILYLISVGSLFDHFVCSFSLLERQYRLNGLLKDLSFLLSSMEVVQVDCIGHNKYLYCVLISYSIDELLEEEMIAVMMVVNVRFDESKLRNNSMHK